MSNLSKTVVNTVKDNQGKLLVSLAGIGVGVLTYFGYKSLPQSKKDKISSSLKNAQEKLKNNYKELEASIAKKRSELAELENDNKINPAV